MIDTAIHGGSLEKHLRESLRAALIDTAAAQGASAIGDLSATGALDDFTNKVAHAIAGCAAGATRADNASGCGAGSLGAVIGEISGNAYGRDEFGNLRPGAVQMAQMFAGIAGAVAGLDAKEIGIAASAGANAAANNALSLRGSARLMTALRACSDGSNTTCDMAQLRQEMTRDADKQAQRIDSACANPSSLGQCMALVTSANLSLTNLMAGYEYANTEEKRTLVADLLSRQLDDMGRLYGSLATQQEAANVRELLGAAITGSLQAAGIMGIGITAKGGELAFDKSTRAWTSAGGLVYGQGSIHDNRVQHVLAHTSADPTKPLHTVFNVGRDGVVRLLDEAWALRGSPQPNDAGVFVIPMRRVVGQGGETSIKIIVRPGTSELITAFPVR